MRILLCDDDISASEQLEKYLNEYFHNAHLEMPEISIYSSGDTLVESGINGDIAFLDVEMPGLSGIHVGERLKQNNPKIKIFIVTSYPDYLDEAMKYNVFRYLTKPVDKKRLYRNMKDALYQIEMETRTISIETNDGNFTRSAEDIIMIEAEKHVSTVITVDQVYHSTMSMKEWLNILDFVSFFPTYRSYLVNMRFIKSYTKSTICLAGPDSKEYTAYLAKRAYVAFKKAYTLYLEATI